MKPEERAEARRLRREEGASVQHIAARLNVSKSTVSRWVRDVPLSGGQAAALDKANPARTPRPELWERRRQIFRDARRARQEDGRRKAQDGDPLHVAGCMLYWAEGSKSRNVVAFTNADPAMMVFFLRFLRCCYGVRDEEIAVHINCFDDCHSVAEIEAFWLKTFRLPPSCLRKTTANCYSNRSQQKRRGTLAYGTCRFNVFRTDVVQSIFGAIQGYAGVEIDAWLD